MKKLLILYSLFSINLIFSQDDGWTLSATDRTSYNGVSMANGQFGIVTNDTPFITKEIILGGVYDKGDDHVSRIVRGIEFLNLRLKINGESVTGNNIKDWSQQIFMDKGVSTISFKFKNLAKIKYSILANRALPYSAMAVVEISPMADITIAAENYATIPDQLNSASRKYEILKDNQFLMPLYSTVAKTKFGRYTISSSTAFLFDGEKEVLKDSGDGVGFERKLLAGKNYRFSVAGGICTSRDFTDPESEAQRQAIFALQEGTDALLKKHTEAWQNLWATGDIQIEGDMDAQQRVRFALFNLYSFIRAGSRQSISPMGLSSQGYNGHVFWDSELWMYPVFLALQPELAESCLDYRADRLQPAQKKAQVYGYKGAMFPWESDDTGEEATPTWALTGVFEQHITADVPIAFWNYYTMSQDKNFLKKSWNLLRETANFWVSRAAKNADGSYSINNVVGADEYAQHINDNAFTNASAIETLRNTIKAADILGMPADPRWKQVADGLRIISNNGITMEYDGYKGEMIKQTDVNLLAYPLHVITDKNQIEKDLDYYAEKIDKKDGPAMAHGILAVLYARMGSGDKAYDHFVKSYLPNSRPPFNVFSESAASNNPYFATGAGAMLQAVIYGFGGVEMTDNGLTYKAGLLPKSWKSLKIIGIGRDNKTIEIKKP